MAKKTKFNLPLLLLVLIYRGCEGVEEYPVVKILKWMTSEENLDWQFGDAADAGIKVQDDGSETVYTVDQHIDSLVLSCNASYPVQWTFSHYDRVGMYNLRTKTYRWAKDIFKAQTFTFSAVLYLYSAENDLTGTYTCEKANSAGAIASASAARAQNHVYIYWLGNSPPYLLQAGKTITVKSKDNKTLVLPCVVAKPDVHVLLYKHVNNSGNYSLMETSNGAVKYNPRIGFSIDLSLEDQPFTTYKCAVSSSDNGDDEDDNFFMTAVPGLDKRFQVQNKIEGNATFSYDAEKQQIKCCSKSGKAPSVRNEYCDNALTCKLRESKLRSESGNNGVRSRNSSCTVDNVYYRQAGIFQCKGDGIDILRHFFSRPRLGYLRNENDSAINPMYFSWDEANPATLLSVRQSGKSSTKKIYANQTVTISCDASRYYFSDSLQWILTWKNGTRLLLNESYAAYGGYFYSDNLRAIKLTAEMEMKNLTCFAPVWNSTEWIQKTLDLNVSKSTPPIWSASTVEEVKISLNQVNKSISCVLENPGDPVAFITWTKNERRLKNDSNTRIIFTKTESNSTKSSTIIFKNVTHDVHGDYKCIARNIGGRVEKIVRVKIDVPSPGVSIWMILLISMVILTLGAGIGCLLWKSRGQRAIIQYLTSVVFKDMDKPNDTSNEPNFSSAGLESSESHKYE